ncbi:MAG: hypothetical protein Q9208_001870 [Pyrenodesmia sp. 3 TL-2023]
MQHASDAPSLFRTLQVQLPHLVTLHDEGLGMRLSFISTSTVGSILFLHHVNGHRHVPTAQVIFVHGLFGHPEKTWSVEKEDGFLLWPKTLLPEVIPDAQVFTWGYDADIDGFLSSAGQSTIHQHAGSLLSDLSDLRVTPQQQAVPLIFVVHSLGGIIVKDALSQSSATAGTRLKSIVPHTYGVIFLGTPHRGSNSATIGRIAHQITWITTKRPNIRLLRGLEKRSEVLDRIGDSFNQIIVKHKLSIYSFREEQETRRYGVFNTMVVDSDSAKIGHANEEYGIIPADHRNMTKYTGLDDIGFKRVSAQLRRWLLDIANHVEARVRLEQVRQAHPATFDWLFDGQEVPFITWLQASDPGDYRPFWIQGKPGSGKSTLMKFAIRNPQTLRALAVPSSVNWTFSGYFFHNRGSYVQKTLSAMLQELLHSILVQNIALVQYVHPIYSTLSAEQKSRRIKWNLTSLRAAILQVLGFSTCKANLCLFLDALDEHAGENEELVKLLWDMARTASQNADFIRLKICIASRPWGIFEKSFGQCPQFAIHEHTRGDIQTYTAQRIREAIYTPQQIPAEAAIVESIVRGAYGVFIWVRLVLDRITQDIMDGTPFSRLQHTIAQLPSELGELYRFTVQRIKPQYHPETWVMFQAVLGALHPLSLVDLVNITDTHIPFYFSAPKSECDMITDNTSKAGHSFTQQLRWLNSRSGGLLEAFAVISPDPSTGQLTRTPKEAKPLSFDINIHSPPRPSTDLQGSEGSEDTAGRETFFVQFIHQTVKDSLMHHGLDLGFDIEHDEFEGSIYQRSRYEILLDASYPSLPSIWPDALFYAKLAEASAAGRQEVLSVVGKSTLKLLDRVEVSDIASMLDMTEFEGWVSGILAKRDILKSLLLAIAANLQLVVEYSLTMADNNLNWPSEVHKAYGIGPYMLNFAAFGPRIDPHGLYEARRADMVETLIRLGCKCNDQCYLPMIMPVIDRDIPTGVNLDFVPLAALCIFHRPQEDEPKSVFDIAKALVQGGASVDTDIRYRPFRGSEDISVSLLEYNVRYGSVEWVGFILSHGATKTSTESGYSLAEYAYLRRDADIIRILTDYGLYDMRRHTVSHDGLCDLLQHVKNGVVELPTCSQAIRIVGEMLMSTIGGVGADLRPKHGPARTLHRHNDGE